MQQGHPPHTDDERERLPQALLTPIVNYVSTLTESDVGRPCQWLDLETRACRHYEHRPQICRDFERGSAMCGLLRWRYRVGYDNRSAVQAPTSPLKKLAVVESCDGCGACCMQQGHPPYTNDERDYVPHELLGPIDEYLASLEEEDFGQPCIWLDMETRQCQHYDHRPQVCRDFERGNNLCVQLRLKFKIA
jgi:Fe-S-cluster containining protein